MLVIKVCFDSELHSARRSELYFLYLVEANITLVVRVCVCIHIFLVKVGTFTCWWKMILVGH